MSMVWTAIGTTAVGLGTSLYGANKNAQAQRDAQAQNVASQQAASAEDYRRWLLTRGIDSNTGGAVNTKLPLWAGVIRGAPGAIPQLVSLPGPASNTPVTGGVSNGRSFATLGITPRRNGTVLAA